MPKVEIYSGARSSTTSIAAGMRRGCCAATPRCLDRALLPGAEPTPDCHESAQWWAGVSATGGWMCATGTMILGSPAAGAMA